MPKLKANGQMLYSIMKLEISRIVQSLIRHIINKWLYEYVTCMKQMFHFSHKRLYVG